ncbi:hypothetical protein FK220_018995 [Flavobacteriaceae bacterium TP-CH-4]|uniref:Attractin/MKLN-like beta-propeller domain-containing protein n=1 Tax=Pelagihabitans pacificus TaxID=2696054 RepID=A0A967AWG1_9FLAO|nr:kelch repeat-containing protein [Pelagihabitans pacificus]NHF61448.1 hypothetical protein [Pelagihabitans pacificus]
MKTLQLLSIVLVSGILISCEKEELFVTPDENGIEETATNGKGFLFPSGPLDFTLQANSSNMGGFANHEIALFKGNLWLVGGHNDHTPPYTSSSQVWASRNGKDWKLITEGLFPERHNHSLIVYKDQLWLIGGIDSSGEILSDIWNSTDGVRWNRVTSLNPLVDIGQNNSVVFNERIFVFRGNGREKEEVWSSSDGSNWRLETEAAFPVRNHYKTVVFNGFIYVYGGWLRDGGLTNEVWTSPDGRYWYQKPPATDIFAPRINHSATVYDGYVWIIGGESWDASGKRTFYGDIWYSENMKYWTRYEGKPPFYKGLHSHIGLSYKNELWVFGGYRPDGSLADVATGKIWSIDQ